MSPLALKKMAEAGKNVNKGGPQVPPPVPGADNSAPPPDVTKLCRDTFTKTAEYLNGELVCTAEDYRLLEQMNKTTANKYGEMKAMTATISKSMKELNDKYQNLAPYLEQIDQIEDSVASLEQAAYKLDAYSKRLEAKFKQMEKR